MKRLLALLALGALLSGCLVTQENGDAWEVAVVEDMEAFYQESPQEVADAGTAFGQGDVGASGGPTTDPDGGGIRAGGGYEPGEQALPNLQCTLTGGRPGETSFQCELSLTGLADEAELPTEAHVLILANGPPRALTAPIAYVAETETHVRFVFLLENAQVGGSHSLRISVADERGAHGANVPLTPTSFNATIGLTADQLGGVP